MTSPAVPFRLTAAIATGIAAGIIFALFEMVAAILTTGPGAALMPLRMIGAIVLGPGALDPGYSAVAAAGTGVILHLLLSIVFTLIFAAFVAPVATATHGELLSGPATLALAGILFGVVLWLVNFYVVAPLAGWSWFPEGVHRVTQLVAHTIFFGAPAGWMLGETHALGAPVEIEGRNGR